MTPLKVPAPGAPLEDTIDFLFFVHLAGYEEHPDYLAWEAARAKALPKQEPTLQAKYNELIYAVARKYPGETRHQTALRYIQQAERDDTNCTGQKSV